MKTLLLLQTLIQKKDLTQKEAQFLVEEMAKGSVAPAQMAAALVLLNSKGETVDEITGFIKGMRKYMIKTQNSSVRQAQDKTQNVIDVCGTGGDGKGTFNISTVVSFVIAGAGVSVAKHGNRAASSKSGSADVLESLGVHINLTSEQAERVLKKVGMVFLFAPLFHPAMKYIGPVRKELKMPTVFNMLGPFLNPAGVKKQIIGVPKIEIAKKLIKVASELNYSHLAIVCGEDGMDEVSISAPTRIFEVCGKKISSKTIRPEDFGIKKASIKKISGQNPQQNAQILMDIITGKKGPERDVVVLNSAVGLYVSGKVKSIQEGIYIANESINSGNAKNVLDKLIKETKKYEQ